MKLWSVPEFFHKNMSHEQLLFTWSTLRYSNMGTKLKYFWKIHETVKSILLAIATGNTFGIICFNVATMVTKMYFFHDCYSFCLCTCSEWIHWFVCILIYLCFDQTHNGSMFSPKWKTFNLKNNFIRTTFKSIHLVIWLVVARPILSHSCLPAINLNLHVRDKSCAIQGGNLSLIRNSKVTVFSQQLVQLVETTALL